MSVSYTSLAHVICARLHHQAMGSSHGTEAGTVQHTTTGDGDGSACEEGGGSCGGLGRTARCSMAMIRLPVFTLALCVRKHRPRAMSRPATKVGCEHIIAETAVDQSASLHQHHLGVLLTARWLFGQKNELGEYAPPRASGGLPRSPRTCGT